jgi:hypothetical protein
MWYWYVLTFMVGAIAGIAGLVIFFFSALGIGAWKKK